MRIVISILLNIDRILLLLPIGLIWILQGIGVLPGSFMSGHILWTIIGAILIVIEAVLIFGNVRRYRAG